MQLCCVHGICLDEFYIGGSLQRVLRVLLFFLFVHGETHDNELRKRKRMEKEEREKKGGRGRKKKKYKENCQKKKEGGSLSHYHLTRIAKNSFVTRDST